MSKVLGLDLGTKTLGIAISNEGRTLALAREVFTFHPGNYYAARQHVLELVKTEQINEIVIGLPLQLDGHEGERAESARRFGKDLKNALPQLIIHFVDERLSTIEAKERLVALGYKPEQIKAKIDMIAATVILETFIKKEQKL